MSDEPEKTMSDEPEKTNELAPLRSSHTSNFPELLQQMRASLVVSTYQAGKLENKKELAVA